MEYNLGDRVLMKKAHPCGSREFVITRTGADFKIKCCGCDHIIMLDNADFKKKVKKIITAAQ